MSYVYDTYKGFNVGDKVRILSGGDFYSTNIGRTGIISKFDPDSALDVYIEEISTGGTETDWGNIRALELIESATVRLTSVEKQDTILQRLAAIEAEIAAIKQIIG